MATVGFPDIGLQGFAPKLAKGEITSLSGAGDDPRYFQISVPVQPGNSGGALVDERGNVIDIVSAMQVTVEMPDQVARQWGETPNAVGRHVMEDAAIEASRAGRLSQRQVGAMLGLDYWQTEAFLNERAVPLN